MKLIYMVLLSTSLFLIGSCKSVKQSQPGISNNTQNSPLFDSLEVLKKAGGFVFGMSEPPTPEEQRYWNILNSFDSMSFKTIDSLIFDKNIYIKMYALGTGMHKYYDSITSKHIESLNDTSSVTFYSPGGTNPPKVSVKEIADMIRTSARREREIDAMKPQVLDSVKSFIRKYSSNPDSYIPVSVDLWSYGGSEPQYPENFEIGHTYQITDNENRNAVVTHFFKFTSLLKISVIENKRSGLVFSIPPKIKDWLLQYGRKLNAADSVELRLK